MKHKPTQLFLILVISMAPLIGFAQDFPVFPIKNHVTAISITGYSNDLNALDAGYNYKLLEKNNLTITAGFTAGLFYPRKKLSEIKKEDLLPFVAPNVELSYGRKHVFYLSFWKNFMQNNEAPFRSALGYRHLLVNKQLALKAFGSFLWIKDDSIVEFPTVFTYGGIGIGLERNF